MTEFVGTMTKIAEKAWQGKVMYSVCIKADSGDETWVGLGADKPPVDAMSRVKVEASQNAKGFWTAKGRDIIHLKDQAPAAPVASGGGGGKSGFQDRQSSIVLQSSYKTATDQVNALLAAGLFKPAANTKDRKLNAIEAYFAFIDKVAVELYGRCTEPEAFLDSYITENSDPSPNPGPNDAEGRPFEDDLPDFM